MAKIGDFAKGEPAFPDAEYTKAEDLVSTDKNKINLKIEALALRKGVQQGVPSEYFIVLANANGKKVSFSCGSTVVMDKLNKAIAHFKLKVNEESGMVTFPETIDCNLVEVKSKKSGRVYMDLVSDE